MVNKKDYQTATHYKLP